MWRWFAVAVLVVSAAVAASTRSEEHTSELQSHVNLVCRLLLEKKKGTPTCSISTFEPDFEPISLIMAAVGPTKTRPASAQACANSALSDRNPLPFFFAATATTEIYTLSLHDALPI